ncbi:hypothetical protein HK102_005826 [Quaeritorhiza haematococci]|nr:hypothetical protein HK102_005826 [Quaeritorhiza haematococci]
MAGHKGQRPMAEHKGRGGHNKQTILLTPDTFKDLCMMAGTPEGKEARRYFRTMELIVKEYTLMQQAFKDQQLFETWAQLEEQARALQAKESELQHFKSKKYEQRENTGFCYVIKTDRGIKVGKTKDIGKRVKGLQTANVGTGSCRKSRSPFPGLLSGSAYQAITRTQILEKLGEKLGTTFEMVPAATPEPKGPKYPHGPFRGFIQTYCKPVSIEDERGWIPVAKFYQTFKNWYQANGFEKHSELHENQVAKNFTGLVDWVNMNKAAFKGNYIRGLRFTD